MTMEVTFAVGGSAASITGVDRAEVQDDHLRCFGGDDGETVLVSKIPLDALESVVDEQPADCGGSCDGSTGDGCKDGSAGAGDGTCGGAGDGSGDGNDDGCNGGHDDGTGGDSPDSDDKGDGRRCPRPDAAAMVTADPSTVDATATHTVALQVDQDIDDFAYFRVDYSTGSAHTHVNDVDEDNIVRFGVDTNDDGVIEKSIATGDWSVSHGGSGYTLRVRNEEWDGDIEPGDDLILEFDGVTNPSTPGTYEVELVLNGHQTAQTAYTVGGGDIHSPDVADDTDATDSN